jgi:hypothetical protein
VAVPKHIIAGHPASQWNPSFNGKIPALYAMPAINILKNTLNPQLALQPITNATAVIISFSDIYKHLFKGNP